MTAGELEKLLELGTGKIGPVILSVHGNVGIQWVIASDILSEIGFHANNGRYYIFWNIIFGFRFYQLVIIGINEVLDIAFLGFKTQYSLVLIQGGSLSLSGPCKSLRNPIIKFKA